MPVLVTRLRCWRWNPEGYDPGYRKTDLYLRKNKGDTVVSALPLGLLFAGLGQQSVQDGQAGQAQRFDRIAHRFDRGKNMSAWEAICGKGGRRRYGASEGVVGPGWRSRS